MSPEVVKHSVGGVTRKAGSEWATSGRLGRVAWPEKPVSADMGAFLTSDLTRTEVTAPRDNKNSAQGDRRLQVTPGSIRQRGLPRKNLELEQA